MDARCWTDRPRPRRAAAALAMVLAAVCAAAAPAPDDGRRDTLRREQEEARLKKVRQDIEDLRARLASSEREAGSVLDTIEDLDMRMALLKREGQGLQIEMSAAQERERAARREADVAAARVQRSETALGAYLRETYKVGPARYLRVIAAASSPTQVAAGYRAVEAMSLGEGRRIAGYRDDLDRLDAALADVRRQSETLAVLQASLRDKTRELAGVRGQKGQVLAGLQRTQASQKALLGDLVEVESSVRSLLDRLARPGGAGAAVPSLGFARYRGRLEWPARGRLAVPFGNVRHPRFSTEVPHPGVDIAAPPGEDVRAVFDGRVVFSDWFKGYGQMVVIDHGDSYLSIYGHVDTRLVTSGEEVARGDVIARSGPVGSFDEPGLYFEIRHEGKPEDPAHWLRSGGTPTERGRTATAQPDRGSRKTPLKRGDE